MGRVRSGSRIVVGKGANISLKNQTEIEIAAISKRKQGCHGSRKKKSCKKKDQTSSGKEVSSVRVNRRGM